MDSKRSTSLIASPLLAIILSFITVAAVAAPKAGWTTLAGKTISKNIKATTFALESDTGNYRRLRLEVLTAPVKIYSVTVTFSDGQTVSQRLEQMVEVGQKSDEISLPEKAGPIRFITVRYWTFHAARLTLQANSQASDASQ